MALLVGTATTMGTAKRILEMGEELVDKDDMLKLQQRVAQLEGQLAESIRQHNQEAGDLQNAMVRIGSKLEQGEAQKHSLEYQLTLSQKDCRQHLDLLEQREKEWNTLKQSFQERVSQLTTQCQDWRSTLDTVQEARAKERAEQQQQLTTKLLQQTALYRKLELVHQQLTLDNTSLTESVSALKNKLDNVEGDLSAKSECVASLSRELEEVKQEASSFRVHWKAADERASSLEGRMESLQSELRTAQAGLKAGAHRARELETLLGEQHSAHSQAVRSVKETRGSVSTLQASLKREEAKSATINDQLHKEKNECESLRQQKREKQSLISELSHQLQLHKSNLQTLKEELNTAKQRQLLLEESHNTSIQDVDSILNSFTAKHLPLTGHSTAPPTTDVSQLPDKARGFLRGVQSHLVELESNVNQLSSDLQAERHKVQEMSKECASYRDVVAARTTANSEAERRLGANSKEIFRLTTELSHIKTVNTSLTSQLEQLVQLKQQVHSEYTSTLNQLTTLRKTHSDVVANHSKFLDTLLSSLNVSKTKNGSSSEGGSDSELISLGSDQNKWERLAGSVTTAIIAMAEALKRTKKEAKHLQTTNISLVATLQSADAMYKESTGKMTSNMESQERQWAQRTNELKILYDTKLIESEERCMETERQIAELKQEIETSSSERNYYKTMLDQAEQRIEEVNNLLQEKTLKLSSLDQELKESLNKEKELSLKNQQLEEQLSQMQEVHGGYKNDRACLLACNCLLAGSLFPTLARVQELTKQKTVLLRQLALCEKLRQQVIGIVHSIQSDIGEPQSQSVLENSQCSTIENSKSRTAPILRFRKVSVVILAVNRLKKMGKRTASLFSITINNQHITVHLGQRLSKHSKPPQSSQQHQATDIASWFRSERVLSDVRDCFSDLQSTLDSITSKQSSYHSQSPTRQRTSSNQKLECRRVIINPTKDCFVQILKKMSCRFHSDRGSLTSDSLCYRLSRGLERALHSVSGQGYCSSTELCESLHTQLTSLIGRLHEGEMKRHTLHLTLEQHKTEMTRLSSACQDALSLESHVEQLRKDLAGMVTHECYLNVCDDLEAALKREQGFKLSLTQHGVAVRQLQTRLQQEGHFTQTKSAALCVLEKELNELRVNLELKEEHLADTRKHLELANKERCSQAQQLGELQSVLSTCKRQIGLAHAAVTAESAKAETDR